MLFEWTVFDLEQDTPSNPAEEEVMTIRQELGLPTRGIQMMKVFRPFGYPFVYQRRREKQEFFELGVEGYIKMLRDMKDSIMQRKLHDAAKSRSAYNSKEHT